MTAFNYARYLGAALDSVVSQADDLEVIVVDDASTDNPERVVARYGDRVSLIRHPIRLGPGAATNRGVQAARGSLLTFLDADDLWTDGRLRFLEAALEATPAPDMVFGHAEEFLSPELPDDARGNLTTRRLPAVVAGGMLLRRATFEAVGRIEEGRVLGEFLDWYARARDLGLRAVTIPDVVLRRRIHASNLGRRERHSHQDYVHVLKQSLDRRRAAGQLSPPH
jgi:glycosyltransferase involved in cell wall biosynthesis